MFFLFCIFSLLRLSWHSRHWKIMLPFNPLYLIKFGIWPVSSLGSEQGHSSISKKFPPLIFNSTSDAGSQYRCGRVGRGSQPPFTPNAPPNPLPNSDPYTKSFLNACFPTFRLVVTDGLMDGPTDKRTDKASYRVACPQLKRK